MRNARWFHEVRACKSCGYKRRVKVLAYERPDVACTIESWSKLCSICKLLERAEIHRRAARRFEKRAADMRMMRSARQQSAQVRAIRKRGTA
jgi:hypothetical protein